MRLLIIDDEVSLRENVARYFTLKGYEVAQAGDGESGLASLRSQAADVVLLDLRLPDRSGLEVLEAIKQQSPATGVIMLTGYGDVEVAVQALQMRADHFLLKPTKLDALDAVIARVAANYARQTALDYLQSRTAPTCGGDDRYVLPNGLLEQVRLLAGSPGTTVLLQGETGTGKGMVASLIHDLGPRRRAPFVDLNCAGLSGTLLESDLFGHERGAFTDAKTMKRGLFEIAAGGSVFLDEIGEMPIDVQAKVLKVVEERKFRRLGGTASISVDVRLISATNTDLAKAVQAGKFRADLYYRLSVMPLLLPPLRKRAETIPALATMFVRDLSRSVGKAIGGVSPEALNMLQAYAWPGNIRELRNVLERAVLLCNEAQVRPAHLPESLRGAAPRRAFSPDDDLRLESVEARHIERVLQAYDGNRTRAAAALGIHRVTLLQKLKKYGLTT